MRSIKAALLGAAVAGAGLAASAVPAGAASSIVSVDTGQPKAEIATTIRVRTISEVADAFVAIKVRATGGPACAPSYTSDPGEALSPFYTRSVAPGDTTATATHTFDKPGTFQFCGWLYNRDTSPDTLIATTTGTYTVASPVGAISGVAAPASVLPGQQFVVTVSGQSEVARRLYVAWRPAGEPPCAGGPSLDPASSATSSSTPFSQGDVLGSFTKQVQLSLSTYGRYRFCSWIASSTSDLAPLGVNETILRVVPPRPAIASLTTKGRRLTARVKLVAAGQLRVVLAGKGRKIVLATRQLSGGRTVTVTFRRPRGLPAGKYTLQATFRPESGGALAVRRAVQLR